MIIVGIDPGTTTTGFAILKKENNKVEIIDYGVIHTTPKISIPEKLSQIHTDFCELLDTHKPQVCAVEKLFFVQNVTTGIAVAQARWVMLMEMYKRGLNIHEFAPNEIKKGITGHGTAPKLQVQKAITMILGLDSIPQPDDAADALAIAYLASIIN